MTAPNDTTATADAAPKTFLETWGALVALSMTMFIIVLDTSMMNVAVPQITEDLGTTVSTVQAVISIYSLTMASLMLAGAKLGNIHGAVKVFRIALYVYGAGTLVAAVSWNIEILGLGWSIIEGVAAAALLPLCMSLVTANYSGAKRALAFGVLGGFQATAAAIGPIFGGFLTEFVTWRAGFAFEVVIVIVVLFLVPRLHSPDGDRSQSLDLVGTLLSVLGIGSIVIGSLLAGRHGWIVARRPFEIFGLEIAPLGFSITMFMIIAGVGFLVAFVHWQRRRQRLGVTPLVRPRVLSNGLFVNGFSVDAAQSVTLAGILFVAPLFMQQVLGFSPLFSGIALLPLSISVFGVSMATASWGSRFEVKHLVMAGSALMGVGLFWLVAVTAGDMSAWDFTGPLLVFGTGTGLLLAQVPNLTLSALEAEDSDEGAGVQNAAKETGTSLGTAIIGSVMMTVALSSLAGSIAREAGEPLRDDERDQVVVQFEDQLDAMTEGEQSKFFGELDQSLGGKLDSIVVDSRVEGMRTATGVVGIFVALAFLGATFLPRGRIGGVEGDDEATGEIVRRAPSPQRGL